MQTGATWFMELLQQLQIKELRVFVRWSDAEDGLVCKQIGTGCTRAAGAAPKRIARAERASTSSWHRQTILLVQTLRAEQDREVGGPRGRGRVGGGACIQVFKSVQDPTHRLLLLLQMKQTQALMKTSSSEVCPRIPSQVSSAARTAGPADQAQAL